MTKYLLLPLLLALSFPGYAEEKKEPTPQALKMKACNAQAKEQGLKGEPRKAFMSNCLKKKPS